ENPKEDCSDNNPQRIQCAQQCHGDPCIAISWGNVFVESKGDSADFDCTGQPSEHPARHKSLCRYLDCIDLSRFASREDIAARYPEPEPCQRRPEYPRNKQRGSDSNEYSPMQPGSCNEA